jgi:50S ribosomal protein L16 3-hydroxylase
MSGLHRQNHLAPVSRGICRVRQDASEIFSDLWWRHFIERHWESSPTQLKVPARLALPTPMQLMDVVRRATQARPATRVRTFLGASPSTSEMRMLFPSEDDENLDAYLRRAASLAARDFSLLVHDVSGISPEMCDGLDELCRGLFTALGTLLPRDVVIYASRAVRTSAGIHVDPFSNFLFQLHGRKRFRLWHTSLCQIDDPSRVDTLRYHDFLGEGEVFDTTPGSMLYIPSNYYHVADSDDRPAVHISLVFRTRERTVPIRSSWQAAWRRLAALP